MSKVENDGLKLAIATGENRRTRVWKNTEITWGKLKKKLSAEYRTYEEVSEYNKMTREAKARVKDIGGFVGGELKNGKRGSGYVISRSVVTLDADYATPELWDDIELVTEYEMLCYSTHSHTDAKPRLRIIVPLARKVTPDEYEAIARKIADQFGMDYFDDTTYQASRLMFWPSTPKNGDWFTAEVEGPILDPDKILDSYTDWSDTSFWPESSRMGTTRKKTASKQGDPLAKDGIVGAFCRTYTIQDAIEKYLPSEYVESNIPDRYTYTGGSTAAGLVIYEEKFSYSNHSTDPTSGKLCNAFDLVRIHKFGDLDEKTKEDTPSNRLPSWDAMIKLATSDKEVRGVLGKEKLRAAKLEFGMPEEEVNASVADTKWLSEMTCNKQGKYLSTIDNMLKVIEHDPNLSGLGGRNVFMDKYEVLAKLPWNRPDTPLWTDLDDASIRHYLEHVYDMEGRQKIQDATAMAFEGHSFHPVKDYLEAQSWDGVKRAETILVDYLGADDNEYTREITRKVLAAAVARIYNPGCKFDYMLTLIGDQGIGKSMLFNVLAADWFSDTLTNVNGKEAYEALDGVWIMEMAELSALRKSDREAIKNYISKQSDTYRKAYGRNTTINKRQCIFIGTTNDAEFLNDDTGGRRFWIVEAHPENGNKMVWEDLDEEERGQIWAEAVEIYKAGENINSLSPEVKKEALRQQESHSENNSLVGLLEKYLEMGVPSDWKDYTLFERVQWTSAAEEFRQTKTEGELSPRDKVSAIEVWCEAMGKNFADMSNRQAKTINECLAKIPGWERSQTPSKFGPYGSQRGFIKKIM